MLVELSLPGASVAIDADWMSASESSALFQALRGQVDWEVHRIRLFGRMVDSPRLSSWIGDVDAAYRYSGTDFLPRAWPAPMHGVRQRISAAAAEDFNSVLANLYRNGKDAMGWHSDDEPQLGAQPVIASLSLGAPRRFVLKHRRQDSRLELLLPPGSLLLMRGDTQQNYRHALPRTARPVGERINLTFRRIVPVGRGSAAGSLPR